MPESKKRKNQKKAEETFQKLPPKTKEGMHLQKEAEHANGEAARKAEEISRKRL